MAQSLIDHDLVLQQNADWVVVSTDAFPGETFSGHIRRIAPVFREATRQARVEVEIPNPDLRLKPGMFARASVVLQRVEEAVTVPDRLIVIRDGRIAGELSGSRMTQANAISLATRG